jgi:two-component system CheB/CheR fusion protein
LALVLVQHLQPDHESQLAEILSRATPLPVAQASDGLLTEADHIYVVPPNHEMTIRHRVLHLQPRSESQNPYYPIDHFFASLAEDQGPNAIGAILSGNGSDGAQGLRAIKSACGITFCQDERSAKFGGMPHSAILTGDVDWVLPPAGIARELARIKSHAVAASKARLADSGPNPLESELRRIISLLKAATNVDFGQYKQSTIRRRIARRMMVHDLKSLGPYAEFLETHPNEVTALYRDLLINFTSFFREPEMFQVLGNALARLLEERPAKVPLRIWVAGCATGEEAYSIAITALEALDQAGKELPIQVFATDLSETAIERARSGTYPTSIEGDVSPERLSRFFSRVDSGYRVKQAIRENCVFARHDLTTDPPFSQMDLISCRNVLIYLGSPAQQRVIPAFHYGLRPGGLLILGSAETIGPRSDLFDILDSENKILVKKNTSARAGAYVWQPQLEPSHPGNGAADEAASLPSLTDVETRASRILRDLYAPPCVIIDDQMQVLQFHGETGFYLEHPPDAVSFHLLQLARESLVSPLRRLVGNAIQRNESLSEAHVRTEYGGQARKISLHVIPIAIAPVRYYLVVFAPEIPSGPVQTPTPHALTPGQSTGALEAQLEQTQRELSDLRSSLGKIVEQHNAANEELKSANEEARSSNEELQSTNEELRTTKEELQSSNEELITVNDELRHRNENLNVATNDLNNVLNASRIPILMVDRELRLRRFTPAAERLLGLSASDIGRGIGEVRNGFDSVDLRQMLEKAVETLAVEQATTKDRSGRCYHLFTRPYRTVDDRIEGAVLTFVDVDDVTKALDAAISARDFAEGIVETVQHPLLVLDSDLRVRRATSAYYRTFQVSPEETTGQLIYDVGEGQWNSPTLRRLMDEALLRDVAFRDLDVTHDFPRIGRRTMRLNARRIVDQSRTASTLLLAIEDITDRREAAEIQYRRLFESAKDAIIILEAESAEIVDVNPYFTELSRNLRENVLGKRLWEIPPFLNTGEAHRIGADSRAQETVRYESVRFDARGGRELVVDIAANRYSVKDRTFIQLNIRDVTEKRRSEETLRRSNLDLQQFAFAASHDLQEPLRTITSYVQLLQRQYQGSLGNEADQYIQFITSAAAQMRQMVLDLLGFSQIVRTEGNVVPVSVEAVLSTALLNLQMAINSSGAIVDFDPLPVVLVDQTHLLQLLQNLIGNAIKYRSDEAPCIHLAARESGTEWVISVQDNGIGLDPRYADHIFTVFKRLHGKEYPGTGIGLAICKRIVERYGGRIWVESQPRRGSTFYFTLPRPKPDF